MWRTGWRWLATLTPAIASSSPCRLQAVSLQHVSELSTQRDAPGWSQRDLDDLNQELEQVFMAQPANDHPSDLMVRDMSQPVHQRSTQQGGQIAAAAGLDRGQQHPPWTAAPTMHQLQGQVKQVQLQRAVKGLAATSSGNQGTGALIPGSSSGAVGPATSAASSKAGTREPEDSVRLTHLDGSGRAAMVDVSAKRQTVREARASCVVLLGREAFELVAGNQMAKGSVLSVAQLAGIMGAKQTSLLIPLCHSLLLSKVDVQLALDPLRHAVLVRSLACTVGQTGVEMEALTAAAVAALTVYDMCKAVSKDIVVTQLQLEFKSGGKSDTYHRGTPPVP